ncbi:hypothetical protein ACFYM0_13545 [Streptomyces sp. NPDC006487]
MAAASCYADRVPQGSSQVRCQEAEFISVRLIVREDFVGVV